MARNSSPAPFELFSSSVDKVKLWLKEAISPEETRSETEEGPNKMDMFWPLRNNGIVRSLGNKEHSECTTRSSSPPMSCSSARINSRGGFLRTLSLPRHFTSTPSLVKRISSYKQTLGKRQQLNEFYQRRSCSPSSSPRYSRIEQKSDKEVPYQGRIVQGRSSLNVPTGASLRLRISTTNDETIINDASYYQSHTPSVIDETSKTQSLNNTGNLQKQSDSKEDGTKTQTVGTNTSPFWYRKDSGFEDGPGTLEINKNAPENPGYEHLFRELAEELSAADPYRVIRRLTLSQIHNRSFRKHVSMNAISNLLTGINADMNHPKIKLSIQYFMSTKELRVCFSEAKMLDTLSPSDMSAIAYIKIYLKPVKRAQKRSKSIQLAPTICMNDQIYFTKVEPDDLSECNLVFKIFKKRRYVVSIYFWTKPHLCQPRTYLCKHSIG